MALYVYITKECEEEAKKHSRYQEMLNLKEKVETAQRICHFDNFPPPYLKKRFDRQIRLLADFRPLSVDGEEHLVVNFLQVYVRSSSEYGRFLNDTVEFGRKHLEPLVTNEVLETFLREQLQEHPIPRKKSPSEMENHFLYRFLGQDRAQSADEFVCESEAWVRSVEHKKINAMLLHLSECLPDLVGDESGSTSKNVRDCQIIYRWFPKLRKLFLAGICQTASDIEALEKRYAAILHSDVDSVPEEQVLKNSMRTYPAFLLADEEGWMAIQRDVESNLALSSEETRVLESVHSNEEGFPIFINGRAGSGKSTILYYLFADYVSLYLDLEDEQGELEPPLLLSCSDELRRRSQEVVSNLIEYNPRWNDSETKAAEVPLECFQEFRSFLRALLSAQEQDEFFSENKYIGYAEFRRMWNAHFGRDRKMRVFGPDLSWHVIRTYIKGTNPEDYLEPEEYAHVPKKQQTVTKEAFKVVHDVVWVGWYQDLCKLEGFWDDQDLARFVFQESYITPVHPAVFCDEAQDFTRVELDLLFRLCVFADRTLTHTDISRVPFAFAGDPFQTLNPTGFRWDAIQALFHDKLVDTLGENLHRNVELNYQELELNYRSTKNIVRICNLIQAIRAGVFEIPRLQPQLTWQLENDSPMPVWFDRDRPQDWDVLQKEADVMIIVPCMLDEEQEFVKNDPRLSEIVKTDELGIPVNVLSPTRAKGLEFGRVVLYGFSDRPEAVLLDILDRDNHDIDSLLPIEYFVNQLYVAASRPKRRLFIIESQTGREKLWGIVNDQARMNKLWQRIPNGKEIWSDYVGGFIMGNSDSWGEDRGNPEENAERFVQQGMATRDAFLLRSAAMSYESLGMISKSHSCKGHALKINGDLSEAGEHFQKAGDFELALKCYWEAGIEGVDSMLNLHRISPDIGNTIEFKLYSICNDPSTKKIHDILTELTLRASEEDAFRSRIVTEKTFSGVVHVFAQEFQKNDATDEEIRRFLLLVQELETKGLGVRKELLAELYYRVGNYVEAVQLWERSENYTSNSNYQRAKASLLADEFEADTNIPLNPSAIRILVPMYTENGKFLLAAKCIQNGGDFYQFFDMLKRVPDDYEAWQTLFLELTEALAARGEWGQLIDIAYTEKSRRGKEPVKGLGTLLRLHTREIRNAIAVTCALHVGDAPNNSQVLKRYSAYFSKAFSAPAQWREDLAISAVGAAFEFTGRLVEILRFYETVTGDPSFHKLEQKLAWKRWIVTKEKQSELESEQGNERAARKYASLAADRRNQYGWANTSIEGLPVVTMDTVWAKSSASKPTASEDTLATQDSPESPTSIPEVNSNDAERLKVDQSIASIHVANIDFAIGDLRFEYARDLGRVNVTNSRTMDTGVIRIDQQAFRSVDLEVSNTEGSFECVGWGCRCEFSREGQQVIAKFLVPTLGIGLEFHYIE